MKLKTGWICLAGVLLACAGSAGAAVTANDLVLVVNKQQPEGRRLAELYAKTRGVPEGRIIELDIPDTVDIAREFYESSIADPIRQQLEARHLREQAKCLVLFYGMPLRIRDRDATPQERTEVSTVIDPMIATLTKRLHDALGKFHSIASSLDPGFKVEEAPLTTDQLRDRLVAANQACIQLLAKVSDEARRVELAKEVRSAQLLLGTMPPLPGLSTTKPATMPSQKEVDAWMSKVGDPSSRQQVRQTLYFADNVYQMLVGLEIQKRSLTVKETEASVDSELSCLFLGNYDRARWLINTFHHRAPDTDAKGLMIRTARIDGPNPQIAQRTFENAVRVEEEGLSGDLVLDARGLRGNATTQGSYEYYDRSIRSAAMLAAGTDRLSTVFDYNPTLLPDGSSERAAIYVGWYQVRKYAPTVKLVPGSIAMHVASLELISLRSPNETGWCRGLMLDGADVTCGAVGEPYLLAFPPADEFLGLLLTGRVTLAEAYWATIPVTSWKMILIGDPLYRPFRKAPVVAPEKLAESLRRVIE